MLGRLVLVTAFLRVLPVINGAVLPIQDDIGSSDGTPLDRLPPIINQTSDSSLNVSILPDPSRLWLEKYLYIFSRYSTPRIDAFSFQQSISYCRWKLDEEMQIGKKIPSDFYPKHSYNCYVAPDQGKFHFWISKDPHLGQWSTTYDRIYQTLWNVSFEAKNFGNEVPTFRFDLLQRPMMRLLATGGWYQSLREESISKRADISNLTGANRPPDPYVVKQDWYVYVFSEYLPPFVGQLGFTATAMFCRYMIKNEMNEAGAQLTDQYPFKRLYCVEEDGDDFITIERAPNVVGWTMTYGDLLAALMDLSDLVRAFDNKLPYFELEIHMQVFQLRPLVARGRWAPGKREAKLVDTPALVS